MSDPDFLDLRAGWRLSVIIPLLKSGGYRIQSLQATGSGSSGSFRTGPDFVGYENASYAITRRGDGVGIEFRSAEAVRNGKTVQQANPAAQLFDIPPNIRHLRVLYLVRVSESDHNMAILGTDAPESLSEVTRRVQAHPDDGCRQELHTYCAWVPAGIAVRPERQAMVDGRKEWVPSR